MAEIRYRVGGEITRRFHASSAFVRGILGPVGSGKSVACCMEIVRRAFQQAPGPDGIRRTRWVVVRNSYPELKSTTIATWTEWFKPEVFGKVKFDAPISHKVQLADDCELEVLFLAMDMPDDAKKLLSLEVTGAWLNEARELPKAILDAATARVGRYPGAMAGGCTWRGVIMDTNPPDDDHWWYELAEEIRPDNMEFFRQPSGLDPEAENLDFLMQTPATLKLPFGDPQRRAQGRQYYLDLIPGKTKDWVKVYVEAQYGSVTDGRPVYPEFNDSIHVSAVPLQPYRGLPLLLGWDFGLTPACVVTQLSSKGQLRGLHEFTSENMGITQFANNVVKPFLAVHYPDMKVLSFIDPAGAQRAQTDERTCRDVLKEAGLHPNLAPTNSFTARREAVSGFLSRLIDGQPGFLLSPECKTLRKGMNGEYRFKRVQVSGEDRFRDAPDKNRVSHVCEALQYVSLHVAGARKSGKKPSGAGPVRRYVAATSAGY